MTTAVWVPSFWMQAFEPTQDHAILDDELKQPGKNKRRRLVCGACKHPQTDESARVEINGGHEHRFFNPSGIIFLIGCFREAPGCQATGSASQEFSWFPNHIWHIALCSNCLYHLGWRYRSTDGAIFFGLILNRLLPLETEENP